MQVKSAEIQVHQHRPSVALENSDGSLDDNDNVLASSQAPVVILQRQDVHPSKNIQLGLELWERVREYDARSAAEANDGFMPVATRNQKQKLKVQHVLAKQPSKSRARGDSQPSDQ